MLIDYCDRPVGSRVAELSAHRSYRAAAHMTLDRLLRVSLGDACGLVSLMGFADTGLVR